MESAKVVEPQHLKSEKHFLLMIEKLNNENQNIHRTKNLNEDQYFHHLMEALNRDNERRFYEQKIRFPNLLDDHEIGEQRIED